MGDGVVGCFADVFVSFSCFWLRMWVRLVIMEGRRGSGAVEEAMVDYLMDRDRDNVQCEDEILVDLLVGVLGC